jgi:SAM-dependent methyltransferase
MTQQYADLNRAQVGSESDPFTERRYAQFARHMKSDARLILDVGCNTGRGGKIIRDARPEAEIVGLDCVPERIASLPEGIYRDAHVAEVSAIPGNDATFDAIVAGEFIEHLTYNDFRQALNEFLRVLKPGGQLLLTTPNPGYVRLLLTGKSVLGGAHLSLHYPKQLSAELKEVGFEHVIVKGSGKVSALIGQRFPFAWVYGSYLAVAEKPAAPPGPSGS